MVADQAVRTGLNRGLRARYGRWRRPLVVMASVTAVVAFLGWITAQALTLPTHYQANNWNVAWVGFDVMLLISLLTTGWAVARHRPWSGTALIVSAAMLICDAWFDVTTASGAAATFVSVGLAAGVELPAAAVLAWSGRVRISARTTHAPGRNGPP
jgi:hypothetical protein